MLSTLGDPKCQSWNVEKAESDVKWGFEALYGFLRSQRLYTCIRLCLFYLDFLISVDICYVTKLEPY